VTLPGIFLTCVARLSQKIAVNQRFEEKSGSGYHISPGTSATTADVLGRRQPRDHQEGEPS
jgi:hypothetical protein